MQALLFDLLDSPHTPRTWTLGPGLGYFLCVATGLLGAALAARWQPRSTQLSPAERQAVAFAALFGAILAAYGLQLPADLLGFHAPMPPGMAGDGMPLGGRTVLGGLLGGWLGVELMKWRLGIRRPTGGDFALPLAIALCCGRIGCWLAGCCGGQPCAAEWYATIDAVGTPRLPVQLLEATFHGLCAVALAIAARRRFWPERRLAAYLALYALVRFALEFWRLHPPIAFGLSWYQFLAMALFGLAGATWWQRRPNGRRALEVAQSSP